MLKRILLILFTVLLLCAPALAEEEEDWSIVEDVLLTDEGEEILLEDEEPVEDEEEKEYTPRDDFIDRIHIDKRFRIIFDGKTKNVAAHETASLSLVAAVSRVKHLPKLFGQEWVFVRI